MKLINKPCVLKPNIYNSKTIISSLSLLPNKHTWINLVKEFLVVIHPYFHGAQSVVIQYLTHHAGPGVQRDLPEDVTDPGARGDEHHPPTHPHPERHLEVLAPPDVHTVVVRADVVEKAPIYREQTTGHGRRSVNK